MGVPERVFDFICRYSNDHRGRTPSLREICEAMGWTSKQSAVSHLDVLQERGWIRRHRFGDGCSNNIEIVMEPKVKGEKVGDNLRRTNFALSGALQALSDIDARRASYREAV